VCLLGPDGAPGEDDLLREAEPDDAGQALAPAPARDDPEVDLGLAELCFARGDPDIAGESELAAAAERVPVDRGDSRLRDRLEEVRAPLAELPPTPRLENPQLRDVIEVIARYEGHNELNGK